MTVASMNMRHRAYFNLDIIPNNQCQHLHVDYSLRESLMTQYILIEALHSGNASRKQLGLAAVEQYDCSSLKMIKLCKLTPWK